MQVVFIHGDGADPKLWRDTLEAEIPGLQLHIWPAVPDNAAITVALAWKQPPGALLRFPNLQLIQCLGMGVDALFADPQLPQGVPIARLIDPSLIAQMSEYICWAVLNHHRLIDDYTQWQREHFWNPQPPPDTAARRIGILGFGTIGLDAARKLMALGFPVHGWSQTPKSIDGVPGFHGDNGLTPFLQQTDILVCLLPLTPQTEGIINTDLLAQLPYGAYVINVARGGHVVDTDLLSAIDSGRIAGATLDVVNEEPLPPGHPYWDHPKIHLTPHIAGLTSPRSALTFIAENLRRLQAGEPVLHQVDPQRQY
jgi:glyoxylate/hydroxypyruvate reductase A